MGGKNSLYSIDGRKPYHTTGIYSKFEMSIDRTLSINRRYRIK